MSMAVDFTKPLTEEELGYLVMRGRMADIERAENQFGPVENSHVYYAGDGTGPESLPATQAEQRADRKRRILAELAEIEAAEGGGDDEAEELPPYEQWKAAELNKELKNRQLPTDGDNAAKAARLRADDEAVLASQQQH